MIDWLRAILPDWQISNLTTDWNDGRCLIALINEIRPGIAPRVTELDPTKLRNNCTIGLRVASNYLRVPQIISPDTLCSRAIDDISMMTYLSYFARPASLALLKWVKSKIPHVRVTNFSSDWSTGVAIAALMEACFPGTIPHWRDLSKDESISNLKEVFSAAQRKLDIEPNLTPKELASGEVEELKVMTYVLRFRYGQLKSRPNEVTVSGPGLKKAAVGTQTYFEVDTKAAGPGRLFIDAFHENGRKLQFSLRESKQGVLMVTYTPDESGLVHFDVLWSDVPIPNSPYAVWVLDTSAVRILDFEHHQRMIHVNTPVEFKVSTKSAGEGTLTASLEYPAFEPIKATVVTGRDSTAIVRFTAPKQGNPVLRLFWCEEELPHLAIHYTVVDIKTFKVTAIPEKRLYHTFEHANFTVESKNLSVELLQMTAIYGDIQIPIAFSSIEGKRGHASFIPTLQGRYRVEIACIDKLVEGSPFVVEVADPSKCRLLERVPQYLQLNEPHEFLVDMKEAGSGELKFEVVDHSHDTVPFRSEVEIIGPKTSVGNSQRVTITPLILGNYLLTIKFHGINILACPFRVTVCDPKCCRVTGDLVEHPTGMVAVPVRFQIVVPDETIKPEVKATGTTAKYTAEIRTTDSLTYAVQFTPWEMGAHKVSITYGTFHIPSSPFSMQVTGLDSMLCSATGEGLQRSLTGIPSQFVVVAKQSGLLRDGSLQIRVEGVVNGVECRVRARDNENGSYNVAYLTQIPGAYFVTIKAAGKHIPGSPFKLHALPGPEPQNCKMYGPVLDPNAITTIGNPMDFTVDASRGGTGDLLVKAVGPGGTQARVYIAKTETKGVFDVKLDPVRHGKYRISVKWYRQHIPGSPFLLKVWPGADASKCKAYGPGLEDGLVGCPSSFTIETRDAGAGTLKVHLRGVKNAFKVDIKPVDQRDVRTLVARYDPRKPGEYLISIFWTDCHVPGSPFKVVISGDAVAGMDDNFATPRHPGLEPISEGEEEEEEEEGGGGGKSKQGKKRRKRKKGKGHLMHGAVPVLPMVPVLSKKGEPMFYIPSVRTPYQVAMIPPQSHYRSRSKTEGRHHHRNTSTVSLPERSGDNMMMTFSNMNQVRRVKRESNSRVEQSIYGHVETDVRRSQRSVSKSTSKRKGYSMAQ